MKGFLSLPYWMFGVQDYSAGECSEALTLFRNVFGEQILQNFVSYNLKRKEGIYRRGHLLQSMVD